MNTKRIIAFGLIFLGVNLFALVNAQPIRGAWLTNTSSDLMHSPEGIKQAVAIAKQAGLTHIFPVVWNKGYTQYRSEVMQRYFGMALDPQLKGFDPLKLLIQEAHKSNIKVIAWFEFGFAAAYQDSGMHLLKQYPYWSARTADGGLVTVNQFTWMNSFHPEVQDFLLQLVEEVCKDYDVDGIQGDDRMPAAPVAAGYDAYTISLYRSEHDGNYPPSNMLDSNWIIWRANKMTEWGKQLYTKVKQINTNLIVAHAPSIYPWSRDHYLQDWPTWLAEGSSDIIIPQVYRYSVSAYKTTLDAALPYAAKYPNRFYPGILASLGNGYVIAKKDLEEVIRYNRSKGLHGEVFFYLEALRKLPEYFNNQYSKE